MALSRNVFLILSAVLLSSTASYSQSCTSSDNRSPVEQLECFCNPKDQSIVQRKVEAIGPVAKTFKLDHLPDCSGAVLYVMAFSEDSKVEQHVSSELGSLGYDADQASQILNSAKRALALSKAATGRCSKSRFSFSIGSLKWGRTTQDPDCLELEKFSPEERERAYISAQAFAMIRILGAKNTIFAQDFKHIDQATELAAKYPEPQISSCYALTSDLDTIGQCLSANADPNKILGCASLNMLSDDALKCLNTSANIDQLRACKSLNMLSMDTLTCLNNGAQPELIRACGRLNMLANETHRCISQGGDLATIAACGGLNMLASDTNACIASNASVDVIRACGSLNLLGSDTLSCLHSGASPQKIYQCGHRGGLSSDIIQCLAR